MKISQGVRDFAAKEGLSEPEALQKGMEVKSVEFVKQGAEVYHKVCRVLWCSQLASALAMRYSPAN